MIPLHLPYREENLTKRTRVLNKRRRSNSAACCRRGSVVPHRHSSQSSQKQRCILVFVPQFLPNRIPVNDLLLAGLIVACVSLLPRLSHFTQFWPSYSRSECERWLPCSFPQTYDTTSPIPLPRRPCRWLGKLRATVDCHTGGVDEAAQHTFFTPSKCTFVHSFAYCCVWKHFSVETGPDHFDRFRVPLQIGGLLCLVIVHLNEPPQLNHNLLLLLENPRRGHPRGRLRLSAGSPEA